MPDVDLVVLWVDGSDPEWLKEKNKYDKAQTDDSNAVYRFRDYGCMKYWFRAVESYMPWFRKVHFVTWGHLPDFLDPSNPKLNIVLHQDFMPDGTLPCFNSEALEMNIFRIKGLADHFIYFNDDIFVIRQMRKAQFFTEKGLPCLQFAESPPIHKKYRGVWQSLYVNDMSLINQYFQKKECERRNFFKYYSIKNNWYDNVRSLALCLLFPNSFTGFKTDHVASAFCKKTFATIWEKEPEFMAQVSHSRFRSYKDVNQWLVIWWQLAEGNFHPVHRSTMSEMVNRDNADKVCEYIRSQKYELICVNDDADEESFPIIAGKLQDAFEAILPNKSSFEL